jgi:hypothetical protein
MLYTRLVAAGVPLLTPLYAGPFGRTGVFADLHGSPIPANAHPWARFPLGRRGRG